MAEEIKVSVVFATAGAKRNVKKFTGELKDMEDQTKKTSKNASGSFASLRSSAARNLGKAGLAGIAVAASGAFVAGMNRSIQKGKEFETALADLEAITGITGDDLDELSSNALDLSVKYGESANNIIEANKLVASQLAEKIDFGTEEGLQQLQEVSEQAVVLQKAAGVDLSTSVRTLTTAINQFNLPASETNRLINSIAAGSKFGAAEVSDQAEAYREAGSVAASANLSFEDLNGATQVLAANAITGSRAGTQMRNVFLTLNNSAKLAEAGIEGVDLQSDGLSGTLDKLNPLLEDSAALEKLFGRESITAAQILIKNADAVGEMTEKVTDSNVAQEQLNVQMETFEAAQGRLTAAIDAQLIPAFQEAGGVMVTALNTLARWVQQTGYAIRVINDFFDAYSELREEVEMQATLDEKKFKNQTREIEKTKELISTLDEESEKRQAAIQYLKDTEEARDLLKRQIEIENGVLMDNIKQKEEQLRTLDKESDEYEETQKALTGLRIKYNENASTLETFKAILAGVNTTTDETSGKNDELSKSVDAARKSYEEFKKSLRDDEKPDDDPIAPEGLDLDNVDLGKPFLDGQEALAALNAEIRDYITVSSVLGDHTNDVNFALQQTESTIASLIENGYSRMSPEVQQLQKQYEELQRAQEAQNAFMSTMANDQIKSIQDIGNAVREQVLTAIKARLAEAIATQIAKVISSVPFPFNIAIAAGVGASVSALFNQIPKFNTGVDDFEGGLAKVHKNEVITYLPKGSNVITNKNVEAMERMNNQPFVPDVGSRSSVTVQPSNNRDILQAIERQTEAMSRMERRVEFSMSEFNAKYQTFLKNEELQGRT